MKNFNKVIEKLENIVYSINKGYVMENIAIIYFSGTGNTRYIAHRLVHKFNNAQVLCSSITKNLDFKSIIKDSDFVFFCYPIYCSMCPEIMENFVYENKDAIKGKDCGVLVTQAGFSGDGAYYLGRILTKLGANFVCAEHFIMPDNICDKAKEKTTKKDIAKILNKTSKRLDEFFDKFVEGKYVKRGCNVLSKAMGDFVRMPVKQNLDNFKQKLTIDVYKCNGCGVCEELCPTKNLKVVEGKAIKADKCTMCYRCVNKCPNKAITYFGKEIKYQYKGIHDFKINGD